MNARTVAKGTRYIAIVDPAMRRPELEALNCIAARSALPVHYHLPALYGMASIHNSASDPDGIIILGSLASVNDNHEWQKAMNDWLHQQWELSIPTFGICYGHQLIAHLHGAKVGYAFEDKTKHVGMRKIQLLANPLWSNSECEGSVAVSHNEEVKECPRGFTVVGKSNLVNIEALAHQTKPIWSFQPHPEATQAFFKNRDIPDPTHGECLKFGHSLVQAFLDLVAGKK